MTTKKAAAQATDREPIGYLISSKTEGFRRAGRAWSKAPQRVAAADLSTDDFLALIDEPMLEVAAVFDEPAE